MNQNQILHYHSAIIIPEIPIKHKTGSSNGDQAHQFSSAEEQEQELTALIALDVLKDSLMQCREPWKNKKENKYIDDGSLWGDERRRLTHISIELANEAGEVVVLEVSRQHGL